MLAYSLNKSNFKYVHLLLFREFEKCQANENAFNDVNVPELQENFVSNFINIFIKVQRF